MLENLISVKEAAKLWGLEAGTVKNLCAQGKVVAKKVGGVYVIDKTQPNPKKKK